MRKSVNYEEDFEEEEEIFYQNQQYPRRVGYITNKVDEVYQNVLIQAQKQQEEHRDMLRYIKEGSGDETEQMEIDAQTLESSMFEVVEPNVSLNRSRLVCMHSGDDGEDHLPFPRPEIRKERKLNTEIKITCARVAVGAQCSAAYSRKAVQIVCGELYGHDYYLTAEEQMGKEPATSKVNVK